MLTIKLDYQYDPTTGLYYDPSSTYYWNSVLPKYLYWENDKSALVLTPSFSNSMNQVAPGSSLGIPDSDKKHKVENQDKVKVAKKIAKDMERWA